MTFSRILRISPLFKKGLVILVDCGWGKGCATQRIELDNPHWRFQSMSAADLVRLSWLSEMKPDYLWRIQDGLEAVTKGGVEILNLNGILNLIGWVRSNHGHFVPHAQLTDGMSSPKQPLVLYPPLNLLRQVRADSDRGLRSPPLDGQHREMARCPNMSHLTHSLAVESARRVYASMDGVRSGNPNIRLRGHASSLDLCCHAEHHPKKRSRINCGKWPMNGCIALALLLTRGAEGATETFNLKVYVEFCDVDPPEDVVGKPNTRGSHPALCNRGTQRAVRPAKRSSASVS